jgi:Fe-S oxidoreductase
MKQYRWFRADRCRVCGQCLSFCPVVSLPAGAARSDRIIAREGSINESLSLSYCTTCNACNVICPTQSHPYELVLERYDEAQRNEGLPGIARLVFPNEYLNIWTITGALLTRKEKHFLKQWKNNLHENHSTIMLTGFYTNLVPFLLDQVMFQNSTIPIAGSEGLWGCGGDAHKLGLVDITETIALLLKNKLHSMKVKKVICFMEAEAAMLQEILPQYYGIDYNITIIPIEEWLLQQIKQGDITISAPLAIRIAVHDNCMSRYLNGKPQKTMREIVKRCGGLSVEMEHAKEKSLCCGWAATIPSLYRNASLFGIALYLLYSLDKRLREGVDAKADVMVTGCPACYIFLSVAQYVTRRKIKIMHLTQVVSLAAGQPHNAIMDRRVRDILAGIIFFLLRWISSRSVREHFHPAPPQTDDVQAIPVLNKSDAKTLQRIRSILDSPLLTNCITQWLIAMMVRLAVRLYGLYLAFKRKQFIRKQRSKVSG